MAILKKINFGNGAHDIAKTIVTAKSDGVMSVAAPNGVTNKDDEQANYQYELDVNVDESTIVKSGNKLAVGTVPAAHVTVAEGTGLTATEAQAAFKELKDDIDKVISNGKTYSIVDDTKNVEGLPANVLKRYRLQEKVGLTNTLVGEPIDILKDNSLLAAKLSTMDATWVDSAIADGTGAEALVLVYKDANGDAQVIHIDVSAFLKEAEFKDGLQVIDHVVSVKLGQGLEFGGETGENKSIKVKIDSTSESFLTVGANGVKLAGVQNAINEKVAALDVTDDNAVAGQYVAAIEETDGVVAVKTRANVSEAVLNKYAKGSDASAVAASDTINQAISKLENQVVAAKDAAKAAIEALDVTDAAEAGQYVSQVSETDGKIAVKRANVSDAKLNGYVKGEKPTSTAIDATDDVKGALAKLEHQVDAAKAAATTKVVEGTDAGNNMEIVSTQSDADGSTTYRINLTDVASKAALDAEIVARKAVDGQEGQTYVANVGTNYISGATSLNDADVKLDAAIKAEADRAKNAETSIDAAIGLTKGGDNETRTFTTTTNYGAGSTSVVDNMQKLDTALNAVSVKVNAIQYKVSGTTLEFFGISENKTA